MIRRREDGNGRQQTQVEATRCFSQRKCKGEWPPKIMATQGGCLLRSWNQMRKSLQYCKLKKVPYFHSCRRMCGVEGHSCSNARRETKAKQDEIEPCNMGWTLYLCLTYQERAGPCNCIPIPGPCLEKVIALTMQRRGSITG